MFNVRDGKPNWLPIVAESEKEALAAFAQQAQRGPVMLFYGDILLAVARSEHLPRTMRARPKSMPKCSLLLPTDRNGSGDTNRKISRWKRRKQKMERGYGKASRDEAWHFDLWV